MILLLPRSRERNRLVDEHWHRHEKAANDLGITVALVDYAEVMEGRIGSVARVRATGQAVYRGWELSTDAYDYMAEALENRGAHLVTDPQRYRIAQEYPGWYPTLAGLTPEAEITTDFSRDSFEAALQRFDGAPVVLRDYVRSAKYYWDEACFIPDSSNREAAWRVATRMMEIRDRDLAGGFVLRRFLNFSGPEMRTWWVDGKCVLVSAHPDATQGTAYEDDALHAVIAEAGERLSQLDLRFVAMDFAKGEDRWWLIEIGDGQVSELHRDLDPGLLLSALKKAFGES